MSHFSFESKTTEGTQPESLNQSAADEPSTLAVSAYEFSALEERILRAVNLVKRERLARIAAEERATDAEARLAEQGPVNEQLKKEVSALRAERDQVRQRMERLLSQLDTLEL